MANFIQGSVELQHLGGARISPPSRSGRSRLFLDADGVPCLKRFDGSVQRFGGEVAEVTNHDFKVFKLIADSAEVLERCVNLPDEVASFRTSLEESLGRLVTMVQDLDTAKAGVDQMGSVSSLVESTAQGLSDVLTALSSIQDGLETALGGVQRADDRGGDHDTRITTLEQAITGLRARLLTAQDSLDDIRNLERVDVDAFHALQDTVALLAAGSEAVKDVVVRSVKIGTTGRLVSEKVDGIVYLDIEFPMSTRGGGGGRKGVNGVSLLSALNDVAIEGLEDGHALLWDAEVSRWVNRPIKATDVTVEDPGDLFPAGVENAEDALAFIRDMQETLRRDGLALGGFIRPRGTVVGAFDDGLRTISLSPVGDAYHFYSAGRFYTKEATDTLEIGDAEGKHYIYYDEDGVLQSTTTFDLRIITEWCIVGIVYWDADNLRSIYFGHEYFHTTWMGGLTHARLHRVDGLQLSEGGALGGFTLGDGSLDDHARFSITATEAWDEDARFNFGLRFAFDSLPVYYRTGDDANRIWRVFEGGAEASFPVRTAGNRALFNRLDGGVWSLVEAGNNNFVNAFVFTQNDEVRPYAVIMGQDEYPNAPAARDAVGDAVTDLFLSGLATEEFKFLGVVILQTANSYSNTVKSRIIEISPGVPYLDLRDSIVGRAGIVGVASHNDLDGLQGGAPDEYFHLTEAEYDTLATQWTGSITGDDTTTLFTFAHGLGTPFPSIDIWDTVARQKVFVQAESVDDNTIHVQFISPPATGDTYTVVITG